MGCEKDALAAKTDPKISMNSANIWFISSKNLRIKEVERKDMVSQLSIEIELAKSWAESLGSFSANALGFIDRLEHC